MGQKWHQSCRFNLFCYLSIVSSVEVVTHLSENHYDSVAPRRSRFALMTHHQIPLSLM